MLRSVRCESQRDDTNDFHDCDSHTSFNSKTASGNPIGAAARSSGEESRPCDVTADGISEDRTGEDVPREMNADWKPELLVALVCEREEDAGEGDVDQGDECDAAVAEVEGGEDEGAECEGNDAVPASEL